MILSVPSSALKGYRFPRSVIGYAVWAYHRFALSLRDVEDLLAERGITVSHETIRDWVAKFGAQIAAKIRRDRPQPADKWHLDDVVIPIRGQKHWLWRAVDGNGDTLEILVQSRRNAKAAKRFLRKLLKRWGMPRVIVTDKLRSYGVAMRELCLGVDHRSHKGLNNVSEASHRHTHRREKIFGRFKSARHAQKFLSVHDQIAVLFRPKRHRINAADYHCTRTDAHGLCVRYVGEIVA
ncbi:MAG: IS6 family transposase [Cypionkella sp.]|uniref:IS6 family transposase n=1 Tax=Cypionkella sp. TaxID=2811411 RepID=UPI002ABA0A5A|nr:IS6 family transposase [Cypionkella sp.]MDZ4309482.1 IS6 family transposase [Cypionkella sp.]